MYFDVYVRRSIMFKGRLLLIFVAVLLISANAHAAMSITTASGTLGADTFLTNDSASGPNRPHGTEGMFEVRNSANSRIKIGYIRFDLSNVTGGDLTGATLKLDMYSDGKGMPKGRWVGIYGLANSGDRTGVEAWPEASTTYGGGTYNGDPMTAAPGMVWVSATAPAPGFCAFNESLQYLGEIWGIKTVNKAYETWTSSPTPELHPLTAGETGMLLPQYGSLNLDAFLAADTNKLVTFVIWYELSNSSSGLDWWFTAKEGATADPRFAPTLILPNATPEPATIALLGLGGLSLLRIRRKR